MSVLKDWSKSAWEIAKRNPKTTFVLVASAAFSVVNPWVGIPVIVGIAAGRAIRNFFDFLPYERPSDYLSAKIIAVAVGITMTGISLIPSSGLFDLMHDNNTDANFKAVQTEIARKCPGFGQSGGIEGHYDYSVNEERKTALKQKTEDGQIKTTNAEVVGIDGTYTTALKPFPFILPILPRPAQTKVTPWRGTLQRNADGTCKVISVWKANM